MVCKTAMKEELVCCVKDHSQDMWIFLAHTWGPHMPGWVQVDERENSWRWHQTLTGCLTFGEWPHFSESQLSWVLNWVTGLWITNTSPNGRWCTLCTHSEMTLTLGKKYEGLFKTAERSQPLTFQRTHKWPGLVSSVRRYSVLHQECCLLTSYLHWSLKIINKHSKFSDVFLEASIFWDNFPFFSFLL